VIDGTASRKLVLVDEAFDALPEPKDEAEEARRAKEKIIVKRYAGAIAALARRDERQSILGNLADQRIEEFTTLPRIEQAHQHEVARITAEAHERVAIAHAHGFHKASWLVGIPALFLGAVASGLAIIAMQNATFDAAARNARENAITGAIVSGNREP
jgi:hypothetical protein